MKPIELYSFTHLNNNIYLTSHDKPITYGFHDESTQTNPIVYKPELIKRSAIEDSQDSGRNSISIQMPLDSDVTAIYRNSAPVESVKVVITRIYDDRKTEVILFTGTVQMPQWSASSVTMKCQPSLGSIAVSGLRCKYSSSCNHHQFDNHCSLDFDTFAQEFSVTSVVGYGYELVIDLAGHKENLSGATIKSQNGWGTIAGQNGNKLTLFRPVPALSSGDKVKIAPGCGQDWTICRDKFNNLANCLAFVDVPHKNPYLGDGLKGD